MGVPVMVVVVEVVMVLVMEVTEAITEAITVAITEGMEEFELPIEVVGVLAVTPGTLTVGIPTPGSILITMLSHVIHQIHQIPSVSIIKLSLPDP